MSGFKLFTSNRLEILVDRLAEVLRAPLSSPLEPEIIVVQSRGMECWLNQEIALHNGICANVEFPFPKAFVFRVFKEMIDLLDESPFSPEIMTWKIMKVLPELIEKPAFESLRNYIRDDNPDLKRFQLAEKIAAVFDQYLIFRPDIITQWDRGENTLVSNFKHSAWQAELWKKIADTEQQESALMHHAALKNLFMEKVKEGFEFANLPRRVSVFGISTLPPFFIEIFAALGQKIQVNFFYMNPCRQYWEYAYSKKEIAKFAKSGISDQDQYYDPGNSLLASMGVSGREFFSLILNAVDDAGEDLFQDPGLDTMLSRIQSDILDLEDRKKGAEGNPPVSRQDRTVQIHSCHSPIREVEVLYENLLWLFDTKQDLLPKDIVVMMPDISTYAPLIQAVFDTPEEESKKIPYSIADTCIRHSSGIADTFLAILTLDQRRFGSADVLDILEAEAVQRKFQLTETDLEAIRLWVRETGVCWGVDAQYKEEIGLPGFNENSWQFGLERMVLGYALSSEDEKELFSGISPYGEIEGNSARILGSFAKFTDALFTCVASLRKDRSLAEWGDELDRVLTDFFVCDEETEGDIKDIRDTLTEKGLAGFAEKSGFNEKVPLDVIRSYLTRRLEGESQLHGFLSSGVTFCTMLPMRSIPFKVVYVLGMNDADYPRTSQKPGFDLMEQKKRLCDRSKRYEDRYLFLETILSARENLIISYQGQSIKDNSEIPPSVLVSELCDYIEHAFEVEGGEPVLEHVVTKHPLQPFSRKYFNDDKKLFSYSVENFLAGAEAGKEKGEKDTFIRKPLPRPSEDEWKSISVDQLYYFFANPSEFLIRNRLNANLKLEDPVKPEEREPFELDNLQQYSLKQELLDMCLAGQDLDAYFETVRASGTLPHGSAGESEYQVRKHEAVLFAKNVMQHTKGGLLKPVEILLDFEDMNISISAVLGSLYPEGQLFFRCANIKTKDRLRAWLYHLALNAGDNYAGTKKTILLGKDEGAIFSEMESDQAMSILKSLIDLFARGLTAPLCFFPETSYAYAEAFQKNREEARALKAARVKWYPGYYNTGDCEDIYIKTCFGSEMPDSDEFRSIAAEVFEPMLNIILPQRH